MYMKKDNARHRTPDAGQAYLRASFPSLLSSAKPPSALVRWATVGFADWASSLRRRCSMASAPPCHSSSRMIWLAGSWSPFRPQLYGLGLTATRQLILAPIECQSSLTVSIDTRRWAMRYHGRSTSKRREEAMGSHGRAFDDLAGTLNTGRHGSQSPPLSLVTLT